MKNFIKKSICSLGMAAMILGTTNCYAEYPIMRYVATAIANTIINGDLGFDNTDRDSVVDAIFTTIQNTSGCNIKKFQNNFKSIIDKNITNNCKVNVEAIVNELFNSDGITISLDEMFTNTFIKKLNAANKGYKICHKQGINRKIKNP